MDLRQLRYFMKIVQENNNITQAAKKLNITQPPLSQQLKALETQLNVDLFERRGKRLELTDVGKIMYERAIGLFEMIDDIQNEVLDVKEGLKGLLLVGTTDLHAPMLVDKIYDFNLKFPLMKYRILQADANRLASLLISGDIEIAIVNLPMDINIEDFHMLKLNPIDFSLFVPKDWDWNSGRDEISFSEIESIPLVLTRREEGNGGSYDVFKNECTMAGIKPNILVECNDIQTVISLVSNGMGASILPNYMAELLTARNLRQFKISNSSLNNDSAIIWRKKNYTPKVISQFVSLFDNSSDS